MRLKRREKVKDVHFEEEEAHLLGDEGTLVPEVEGTLEGGMFAEEEGCIVQVQRVHCFLKKGCT
jgi:hypothetical protein